MSKKKPKPKKIQPEYDIITYLGSKCRVCHFGNEYAHIELENRTKPEYEFLFLM